MALPKIYYFYNKLHLQYVLDEFSTGLGLAYFMGSPADESEDINSAKFYSVKMYLYCEPFVEFNPVLDNIKTYDEVNIWVETKYACQV